MVNDQLIRIHHLRLLSNEKTSEKKENETTPHSTAPPSPQLSPLRALSSSAPESSFVNNEELDEDGKNVSPKRVNLKADNKKHRKRFQQTSKSQNSSPIRYDFSKVQVKKQASNDSGDGGGGGGGGDGGGGGSSSSGKLSSASNAMSHSKRRSSWRHLLSPSYKSRSDEFHKLFCDEIPKNERLVADYSCALHRELLIQGRIYVSINYIAFYSNLFSWITKLVVRLRDVSEIHKANTARIIPNAIQFVTSKGEKHIFASFLARDKSYAMILRIWRNNLMKERMTDQEIRSLVHCGYGKDLGMSDNEELKINSPDPKTPSNVVPEQSSAGSCSNTDGNNNSDHQVASQVQKEAADLVDSSYELPPQRAPSPLDLSEELFNFQQANQNDLDDGLGHARYRSIDYQLKSGKIEAHQQIVDELLKRLNDLSQTNRSNCDDSMDDALNASGNNFDGNNKSAQTHSPAPSSLVVVDTPDQQVTTRSRSGRADEPQSNRKSPLRNGESSQNQEEKGPLTRGLVANKFLNGRSNADKPELGQTKQQQTKRNKYDSNTDSQETVVDRFRAAPSATWAHESTVSSQTTIEPTPSFDGKIDQNIDCEIENQIERLNVECGCLEHEGHMIADVEFEIDVNTLFSLIFTNSKFMRAHMIKRGIYGAIITKWKRSSANESQQTSPPSSTSSSSLENREIVNLGDKSNSSSSDLSRSAGRRDSIESRSNGTSIWSGGQQSENALIVNSKHVRQLDYSMNVNHLLAKHIKVTEKQKICSAKPGAYVLKSISLNSGAPYAETFTIDLTYCLTRLEHLDKSRMLVHCVVNFKKEKHSWKLAMIKSTIEKSSLAGVSEFITDLVTSIKEYIEKQRKRKKSKLGSDQAKLVRSGGSQTSIRQGRSVISGKTDQLNSELDSCVGSSSATGHVLSKRKQSANQSRGSSGLINEQAPSQSRRGANSVRAKSKLKEEKLRSMYKYYINDDAVGDYPSPAHRSERPNGDEEAEAEAEADADDSSICASNNATSDTSSMLAGGIEAGQDDNGSMVIMVTTHESDSQVSDAGARDQNQRGQGRRQRATSTPTASALKTGANLEWSVPISWGKLVALIVVPLLLLTIVGLGFSCFIILRRLDSIEAHLRRMNCQRHGEA